MPEWSSDRRLTAIARNTLSVPVRQALLDQQLTPGARALDYGCGRGDDVRALRHMRFDIEGWDPFYTPDTVLRPSQVVLLTYVLNVVEDPAERRRTLEHAWSLTTGVLVVSTRLAWERTRVRGEALSDGVLTSHKTFQHLYGTGELRDFVRETTGARCVSAAPGIVYAFRNEHDHLTFLARRIIPDSGWLESKDAATALAAIVERLEQRGRLPRLEELPGDLAAHLAHLGSSELRRLAEKAADPAKIKAGARRSTLNTLLFLGVELFNGRGPLVNLPLAVQADIRAFFTSYKEACRRADRLLFKLRDDTYLRAAMNGSPVGKLTPTALYVHRRAVDQLPVVLLLYEHCAAIAAGRPGTWDLIKLHHQGRAVSYLGYPEFDTDPHPRLASSYVVDLKTLEASYFSYAARANRPLLHRKHEFLSPDDPVADRYRRLTAAEVRAGLYENPSLIGTEQGWERELERCGRQLRGHRLVRRTEPTARA
ncbi:DNA phosphorothioation-associated putative methyltransferase [Actinocrinis puniceicyclus]|uniref:DNA phosphorothioation-associated putative methyltransferase n=1 Tax=Actinocrinis puniceicyclus TaxID=977794 RepID=A0A8J8BEY4_9ACTN|nr:DNA phosphorothioation-associated putative methyltransferase [Actinocrinis puniceicyclus]MBS2965631.1 DNA phosphorothioation-associated putative methyltransferase [Actinocrinis puniceicyclus]